VLEQGDRKIPVKVSRASKLSLHVITEPGSGVREGAVFDRLCLQLPDREAILSRCRVEGGQLVFLDDVFDCDALFKVGRVSNLLGFMNELPLVLAQRERIKPQFRDYVAELTYDLSVYKKFFDEQDRVLSKETPAVAAAAQRVLLSRAGGEFFKFLDRRLEELAELVDDFTPEEHERHGYYFRRAMWPYLMAAAIMQRTNLKPRGYAGDAVMMEMIYDNKYVGRYAFNKLLHKHPVEQTAAQAVRNRRVLVPKMMRETLATSQAQPFRILSVACGPARELDAFFVEGSDYERLALTLLDQDEEALAAARSQVETLSVRAGRSIDVTWVNDSVRTLLRTRDLAGRHGRFEFIYTMGMFDYLTPPVAKALLSKLYELLTPGGAMVIGNYHAANPSRYYMAYWHDWVLYYRTEAEMLELAAVLPQARHHLMFDDSGCQMFLKLERP
jgi:extracellular factor (EF) 3-hydroxypalmitic acid methyl ester biosynthesis protein